MASEEVGQQDSEGPYFGRRRLIPFLEQDLGGCVGGGAKEQVVVRTRPRRVCDHSTAEIDQLDLRTA